MTTESLRTPSGTLMRPLEIVVAMARNRCIGRGGALPWRIPEDLRHFREITDGHAVIVGRKTFESIGRPLPGRDNIVVTRRRSSIEGATAAPTIEAALAAARAKAGDDGEIFVLGGAEIFRQVMSLADRLYVTEVDAAPEGDAYFPPLDPGVWREVRRDPHSHPQGDSAATSFVVYERRDR